jgi:hypothetical protein
MCEPLHTSLAIYLQRRRMPRSVPPPAWPKLSPSRERTIVEFGRYRILPHRRELLADGQPIRIGGRAFDVLIANPTNEFVTA